MNNLNIEEVKNIFEYILSNNARLSSIGKKPTAIEIVGESGIGKTSAIIQIAEEKNMDCVKLNLTMIEELGDLVGYPIKEYEVLTDEEELKWVPEDLLKYTKIGIPTGKSRMSYSPPAWLPSSENPNGGILILDDYNRADPRFIQATMELK